MPGRAAHVHPVTTHSATDRTAQALLLPTLSVLHTDAQATLPRPLPRLGPASASAQPSRSPRTAAGGCSLRAQPLAQPLARHLALWRQQGIVDLVHVRRLPLPELRVLSSRCQQIRVGPGLEDAALEGGGLAGWLLAGWLRRSPAGRRRGGFRVATSTTLYPGPAPPHLLQHDDLVALRCRRQAVCDHDTCAAARKLKQRTQDLLLCREE